MWSTVSTIIVVSVRTLEEIDGLAQVGHLPEELHLEL